MQQPTLNVQNGFKILYYNARSILPKIEELRLICPSENPDIVSLVETWLDGDIGFGLHILFYLHRWNYQHSTLGE